MADRDRISPKGLTVILEEPLPNVSCHVRALNTNFDFLELVSERSASGSVEHFYSARIDVLELDSVRRSIGLD